LYFFDDKSDILILLIRHDGSLDFFDLIWESGKVG
jgi:hypothetical protein